MYYPDNSQAKVIFEACFDQMINNMVFSNKELDIERLPRAEEVLYVPLDKRYHSLLIVEGILFFILVSIAAAVIFVWNETLIETPLMFLLIFIWALLSFWLLWSGFFSWKFKGYALREKDILFKSGIFFRSKVIIAFHRVQHIEIHQGPLERLFGITSITLFTAGGGHSDLTIPGLHPELSAKIKDWITKSGESDEEE